MRTQIGRRSELEDSDSDNEDADESVQGKRGNVETLQPRRPKRRGQVKNVTVDRSGCGRERRRRTGGPIGRGCRNNGEKIWQRGRSSRGEAQEARSDDV